MDPRLSDFPDYSNAYAAPIHNPYHLPTPDFDHRLFTPSLWDSPPPSIQSPTLTPDDGDFSETAKFITQILMEETMEDNPTIFDDPLGLQLTEKSFYDALGEAYPYSAAAAAAASYSNSSSSSLDYGGNSTSPSTSASSDSADSRPFPTNGLGDGLPTVDELLVHNIFGDSDSVSQFRRGVEEASKFLPKTAQLYVVGVEAEPETKPRKIHREREENEDDSEEDERISKQSAVYAGEEEELSEMFDKVLLNADHSCCKEAQPPPPEQQQSGGEGKSGKQQRKRKETVDLRTLLMLCAQAVSGSDARTAQELLKQIRQNSSPLGDGSQRLAYYFGNALESRLAGTGTDTKLCFSTLLSKSRAADILKAYQLNLASTPFKKLSMFYANNAILKAAEGAACLHIVDFGILYGFQWPILIKSLATRDGGPPRLRITGIEYPQKGFRPAERIEETGRRLDKYCRRFGVPFEYNTIPSDNWETIRVEDIGVRPGEVVAVNCLMRFKNLLEETAGEGCPRNAVLGLIRELSPAAFVLSIASGAYNAPFFVTRFREALFHFSALFDALDNTIPRGNEERLMYEREFYGREAMNVIACEGTDRMERPETYKQWHVRNTRAGFRSVPPDRKVMDKFREKIKAWYHKDFVMDEDNNWMLQGWKGRIVYASSCWVPV